MSLPSENEKVTLPEQPTSPLNVELFLCGLYLHNRSRTVSCFDRPEPLLRMVEEICGPECAKPIAGNVVDEFVLRERLSTSVHVDEELILLLRKARDIASDAGGLQ